MNVKINSSLSALGNLLAAIVESNPAFAVITEAELGVVSTAAVTADAEGRNTVVVVNATGYADTQSFTYQRLGLTDSVVAPVRGISLQGTETADQIKAIVASALNLVASELSISAGFLNADGTIAQPTPAADGSVTGQLVVASNTGSLLYVESQSYTLVVNFPSVPVAQPVSISTLVVNSALNGFATEAAPAAPASTGTTTTEPAAPAADGQASGGTTAPAADGQAAAGTTTTETPAATDGQPAAPAADAQPASTN